MSYPVSEGAAGMKPAVERLCLDAQQAVLDGHNILIISDRAIDDGKKSLSRHFWQPARFIIISFARGFGPNQVL